jgi:predicted house-cleaning noncanonical NTP pyrophosphatase (MazG superfamily)
MDHFKLVIDKIPDVLDSKGITYKTRIVEGDEYKETLKAKLDEETEELRNAQTPEEILEERADVEEVLRAFNALGESSESGQDLLTFDAHHGLTPEDIEAVRAKKFAERGGFEKGIFLETTDA